MNTIHCIHDKTFKKLMSDIRVARDFFEEHLPAEVLSLAKLNTLQLSPGTFIDENLKEFMSDLLYKVDLRTETFGYFYILCEHKSKVDYLMPFTLLNYMVKIWTLHLEQTGEKRLPLIFPLVFYHGVRPYNGCRALSELIQAPQNLIQAALLGPFHLIDTHEIKDEDLRNKKWSGIMNFMFKHVFERDIWPHLAQMLDMLEVIQKEDGAVNFSGQVLEYWILASELKKQDPQDFIHTVRERLSGPIGEKLMTMAEQLRIEGESNLLVNLLEHKFNGIPYEYRQNIEKAKSEQLTKWAKKVLVSKSLENVFE
jgi:predicted transposase/invertase (TIGR01784 family)